MQDGACARVLSFRHRYSKRSSINTCRKKGRVLAQVSIDVAATLPDSAFVAKDYLNGRYWEKRDSYVSAWAQALVAAGFTVTRSTLDQDARKPVLVVRDPHGVCPVAAKPKKKGSAAASAKAGAGHEVRVIACCSPKLLAPVARVAASKASLSKSLSVDQASLERERERERATDSRAP